MMTAAGVAHAHMTREELVQLHAALTSQAREILKAKNVDYAGGGGDPFSNFRGAPFLGVEPEIGLLIRCMDKFKRIEAFVHKGELAVKNEPVEDAILDVINYMVLLAGLIEERKPLRVMPSSPSTRCCDDSCPTPTPRWRRRWPAGVGLLLTACPNKRRFP